jgi:uncharacterized protein with HEPN domain
VALRNRIAHGYETVDHLLVWQIITLDAPQLASAMDRLLAADSDLPYDEGSST